MNVKKNVLFALLFVCTMMSLYGGYSGSVKTDPNDLNIEASSNYDFVSLKDNYAFTEQIGSPQLPIKIHSYVIPMESSVGSLSINSTKEELLDSRKYNIYPSQPQRKCDDSVSDAFVKPNDIYNSGKLYPAEFYKIRSEEYKFGYHIVTIEFYPVQYDTKTKSLKLITDIDFSLNYIGSKESYIVPKKQNEKMYDICKNLVKSKVENPDDVNFVSGGPKKVVKRSTTINKLNSKSMPYSTLLPDTQYVIVTSNVLAEAFQVLADWKTKKGVPTIVETTDNIYANYSGNYVERIKNYLLDIYSNTGSIYVLIGGDYDIVQSDDDTALSISGNLFLGRAPVTTVAQATSFVTKTINYEKMTNLSGDELKYVNNMLLLAGIDGERGVVMNNPNTTISISENEPYSPYSIYNGIKNLYTANNVNCLSMFQEENQTVNGHQCVYLHGDMPLNRENALTALNGDININNTLGISTAFNNNFGIVMHMDHADYTCIGTGNHQYHNTGTTKQKIYREDASNLENLNSYGGVFSNILVTEGCYPGYFIQDCIAERFVNNALGGSVAVIANISEGHWSSIGKQKIFLNGIYNITNSELLKEAFHIGISFELFNNYGNEIEHLFGDPELSVWSKTPEVFENIDIDIVNADGGNSIITTGNNIITVNLNENVGALVCLKKSGEAYASGYTTNGSIYFNYTPDTIGSLEITISAKNYLPYETTREIVASANPYLYVSNKIILDGISGLGSGDADGSVNGGENIVMPITITNSSNTEITGISGTLTANSALINFISLPNLSFSDLGKDDSSTANFSFIVDPNIVDGEIVEFTLLLNTDNGSFTEKFNIRMKNYIITIQQRLERYEWDHTNGIFHFEIGLEIQNLGNSHTKDLTATITTSSGNISNLSTNSINYGTIDSMSIDTNTGHFSFDLDEISDFSDIIEIRVTDNNSRIFNYQFGMFFCIEEFWGDPVVEPWSSLSMNRDQLKKSIVVFPGKDQITLEWAYQYSINSQSCRYNIYKSENINGNYYKLNFEPITGTTKYIDYNCEQNTKYYYKLGVLLPIYFPSGSDNLNDNNIGLLTEPIQASTSLATTPGWPVSADVLLALGNSPTVADFNHDGEKNIFVTGSDNTNKVGYVMGFNADGTEISKLDLPHYTLGFARIDKAPYNTPYGTTIWSKCAVGDIDNDGIDEVVVTTRSGYNSICVYKKDTQDQTPPTLMYAKHLDGVLPTINKGDYIFADPVIADINNDGFKDVVVLTEKGRIYAVDYQGNYLPGCPIIVAGASNNNYGGLAVGDIDGDDINEIVYGIEQGIYACKWDGNLLTGPNLLNNSNYKSDDTYTDGELYACKPVIANIDLRGNSEILISTAVVNRSNRVRIPTNKGKVYALNADGSIYYDREYTQALGLWNGKEIVKDEESLYFFYPTISVADVAWTFEPEIFIGGKGMLYGWYYWGENIPGFPISEPNMNVREADPVIADIDGDNLYEIVMASANNFLMYAYNIEDGTSVQGWPIRGNGDSPYIGDIDKDGMNEIITSDDIKTTIAYDCIGQANFTEWETHRANSENTAVYKKTLYAVKEGFSQSLTQNQKVIIGKDQKLLMEDNSTFTIYFGSSLTLEPEAEVLEGSGTMIKAVLSNTVIKISDHRLSSNVLAVGFGTIEVGENSYYRVASGSTLTIGRYSKLVLNKNSQLFIESGSELLIKENAVIEVHEGASIIIEDNGSLVIKKDFESYGNIVFNDIEFNYMSEEGTSWEGIVVGAGCYVKIEDAVIRGARCAVSGNPETFLLNKSIIESCEFGINLMNCNDYIISNTEFIGKGTGEGLTLVQSNGIIENNTLKCYESGIFVVSSNPQIIGNNITENVKQGVYVTGLGSYPIFVNSSATEVNLNNSIYDNLESQISLVDVGRMYLRNGYNNIYTNNMIDTNGELVPAMPCIKIIETGAFKPIDQNHGHSLPIKPIIILADNNYWGATEINSQFFDWIPKMRIDFTPFALVPYVESSLVKSQIVSNLLNGIKLESEGKYNEAKAEYIKIVKDQLDSEEAYCALSRIPYVIAKLNLEQTEFQILVNSLISDSKKWENKFGLNELKFKSYLLSGNYFEAIAIAEYLKDNARSDHEKYLAEMDVQLVKMVQGSDKNDDLVSKNKKIREYLDLILDKSEFSDLRSTEEVLPKKVELYQNYPNPFNPITEINYSLVYDANVSIVIYNIKGEIVQSLVNTVQEPGFHKVSFNASNLSGGIYLCNLVVDNYIVSTKKMVLVK